MGFRLGFGTWNFSGEQFCSQKRLGWPELPIGRSEELINKAFSSGIRFFDTSDFYGYGRSEKILGDVLGKEREALFATKGGLVADYDLQKKEIYRDFSASNIDRSIDSSLRNLRRNHLDVYQLHGPDLNDLRRPDLWAVLMKKKGEGVVSAVGVSVRKTGFGLEYMAAIADNPIIEYVQLPSNYLLPNYLMAARFLKDRGKHIIGRSPFMHGLLLKDKIDILDVNDQRRDFMSEGLISSISQIRSKISLYREKVGCENSQFIIRSLETTGLFEVVLFGASKVEHIQQLTAPSVHTSEDKAYTSFVDDVVPSLRATL